MFKLRIIANKTNDDFKNKVKNKTKNATAKYFVNSFNQSKNNNKKNCRLTISILRSDGKPSAIKKILDGNEVTDPTEIVNLFNKYFCPVEEELSSKLPEATNSPLHYIGNLVQNSFYFFQITMPEYLKII